MTPEQRPTRWLSSGVFLFVDVLSAIGLQNNSKTLVIQRCRYWTCHVRCANGDILILYGPVERIEDLDQRRRGKQGDAAHAEAIKEHNEELVEQEELDEQIEQERQAKT